MTGTEQIKSVLLKVNTFAALTDSSRSAIYAAMKAGNLRWVPFGSDRRIPVEELERIKREGLACITEPKTSAENPCELI